MKKTLFAMVLAVVATACYNGEDQSISQSGKMTINATTRSEVSSEESSSNGTFTLPSVPKADDLKVEISGHGELLTWNTLKEFSNDKRTFTSDTYTVTLSHGEKGVEGWSKPYFEGSATVLVPGYGLTADVNVEVLLQNSIVAIETTDNFNGYFPQSSFKVKTIDWDAAKDEPLFMNAGEVTITCTATRQTGTTTELQSNITLKPTTRHKVVFDLSTAGNCVVNVVFDDKIVETIELDVELNDNKK
uniref:DUF4493 domain-containing protein n=1 Tax=Alistipes sp. TaxID=1872444 RepID=UPI004055A9B7